MCGEPDIVSENLENSLKTAAQSHKISGEKIQFMSFSIASFSCKIFYNSNCCVCVRSQHMVLMGLVSTVFQTESN